MQLRRATGAFKENFQEVDTYINSQKSAFDSDYNLLKKLRAGRMEQEQTRLLTQQLENNLRESANLYQRYLKHVNDIYKLASNAVYSDDVHLFRHLNFNANSGGIAFAYEAGYQDPLLKAVLDAPHGLIDDSSYAEIRKEKQALENLIKQRHILRLNLFLTLSEDLFTDIVYEVYYKNLHHDSAGYSKYVSELIQLKLKTDVGLCQSAVANYRELLTPTECSFWQRQYPAMLSMYGESFDKMLCQKTISNIYQSLKNQFENTKTENTIHAYYLKNGLMHLVGPYSVFVEAKKIIEQDKKQFCALIEEKWKAKFEELNALTEYFSKHKINIKDCESSLENLFDSLYPDDFLVGKSRQQYYFFGDGKNKKNKHFIQIPNIKIDAITSQPQYFLTSFKTAHEIKFKLQRVEFVGEIESICKKIVKMESDLLKRAFSLEDKKNIIGLYLLLERIFLNFGFDRDKPQPGNGGSKQLFAYKLSPSIPPLPLPTDNKMWFKIHDFSRKISNDIDEIVQKIFVDTSLMIQHLLRSFNTFDFSELGLEISEQQKQEIEKKAIAECEARFGKLPQKNNQPDVLVSTSTSASALASSKGKETEKAEQKVQQPSSQPPVNQKSVNITSLKARFDAISKKDEFKTLLDIPWVKQEYDALEKKKFSLIIASGARLASLLNEADSKLTLMEQCVDILAAIDDENKKDAFLQALTASNVKDVPAVIAQYQLKTTSISTPTPVPESSKEKEKEKEKEKGKEKAKQKDQPQPQATDVKKDQRSVHDIYSSLSTQPGFNILHKSQAFRTEYDAMIRLGFPLIFDSIGWHGLDNTASLQASQKARILQQCVDMYNAIPSLNGKKQQEFLTKLNNSEDLSSFVQEYQSNVNQTSTVTREATIHEHPVKDAVIACHKAITENVLFFSGSRIVWLQERINRIESKNEIKQYSYTILNQIIENIIYINKQFTELLDEYYRKMPDLVPNEDGVVNLDKCLSNINRLDYEKKDELYSYLDHLREKVDTLHQEKKQYQSNLYYYFLDPDVFKTGGKAKDRYWKIIYDLLSYKSMPEITPENDKKYNEAQRKYNNKVVEVIDNFYENILTKKECDEWKQKYAHDKKYVIRPFARSAIKKVILTHYDEYQNIRKNPNLDTQKLLQIAITQCQTLTCAINDVDYHNGQALEEYCQDVEKSIEEFYQSVQKKWKDKIKELEELIVDLIDPFTLYTKGLLYFNQMKMNDENTKIASEIVGLDRCLNSRAPTKTTKNNRISSIYKFNMTDEFVDSSYETHPQFYVESFKRIMAIIPKLKVQKAEKERMLADIKSMKNDCQNKIENDFYPGMLNRQSDCINLFRIQILLNRIFNQALRGTDYIVLQSKDYPECIAIFNKFKSIMTFSQNERPALKMNELREFIKGLTLGLSEDQMQDVTRQAQEKYNILSKQNALTSSSESSSLDLSSTSSSSSDSEEDEYLVLQDGALREKISKLHDEYGSLYKPFWDNNNGHNAINKYLAFRLHVFVPRLGRWMKNMPINFDKKNKMNKKLDFLIKIKLNLIELIRLTAVLEAYKAVCPDLYDKSINCLNAKFKEEEIFYCNAQWPAVFNDQEHSIDESKRFLDHCNDTLEAIVFYVERVKSQISQLQTTFDQKEEKKKEAERIAQRGAEREAERSVLRETTIEEKEEERKKEQLRDSTFNQLVKSYENLPKLNSIENNVHESIRYEFETLQRQISLLNPVNLANDTFAKMEKRSEEIEKLSLEIRRINKHSSTLISLEKEVNQLKLEMNEYNRQLGQQAERSVRPATKDMGRYEEYLQKEKRKLKREKESLEERCKRINVGTSKEQAEKQLMMTRAVSAYKKLQLPPLTDNTDEMHPSSIDMLKKLHDEVDKLGVELKDSDLNNKSIEWIAKRRIVVDEIEENINKFNQEIATVNPLYIAVKALCTKLGVTTESMIRKSTTQTLSELIKTLDAEKQVLESMEKERSAAIDDLIKAYEVLPQPMEVESGMHLASQTSLRHLKQLIDENKPDQAQLEKIDKKEIENKKYEIIELEKDIYEANVKIRTFEALHAEVNALCIKTLSIINKGNAYRKVHEERWNRHCIAELKELFEKHKINLSKSLEEREERLAAIKAEEEREAQKRKIEVQEKEQAWAELVSAYNALPKLMDRVPDMHAASECSLRRLNGYIKEKNPALIIDNPAHSNVSWISKQSIETKKKGILELAKDIHEATNKIITFEALRKDVYALYAEMSIACSDEINRRGKSTTYNEQIERWNRSDIAGLTRLFTDEKIRLLDEKARRLKEQEAEAEREAKRKEAVIKAQAEEASAKAEAKKAQAAVEAAKKALEAAKLIEEKATEALDESKWEETERKLSLDLILSEEKEKKLEIEKQEEEIKRLTALEESIKLAALEKEAKRAVLLQRLAWAQESEEKAKAALTGAVLIEEKMKAEAEEEKRLKEEEEKALREAREKEVRLQVVLDEAVKVAGEKKEGVDIKVKEQNGLLLEIADHEKTIKEYQEAIASIEAATLASLHKELSDAQELEAKAKTALKGAVAAETKAKAALEEATAEKTKAANVMKEITEEGKKEERLSAILKAAREEERKAEEVLAKLKEKEAEQLAKVKEAIEAAEKISQRQKRQEKRLAKEAKRQAKLSELQTKMASLSPQLMTITDNMHLASKARLKHLNQKIQTMDQLELNALPLRAVKTMLAEVTALAAEIKEANETIDAVEKLKVDLIKLRQATSRSHEGYVEIGDLAQLKKALEAEKAKIEEEEKARETKVAILAGKRAALTSPMAATAVIAPACQAYLGELAERYRQEQEKGKSDAYVSIEEVNAQIAAVDLLAEAITQAPEEIKAVQALLTEVKELEEAKLIPAQDAASIQNMKELKRALESVKQRGMLALNAEIEIVEKKREALKEELNKLAQDYACLNRKTDDASIAYVEMLKIHQAVCKETLETLEAIEIKQDSPLAENAGKITKLREEMERINYVLERSEAKREEYLEGMVQTYNEKIANLSEDKTYQALNKQIEELEKEYQTLSEEGLKDKETKAYLSYLKAECDRRRNAAEGMLDDHKYINLNSGVLTIGKVLEREQGIEDQKAVLVHLFSERQAIDARRKHYEEAKERIGLLEALTRYRKMMETFVWQRTEAPLESVSKLIHPCEEYAELDKTRLNKKRIKGGSGQGVIPLGKIKSKETSLLEATTTINEKAVPQSSLFSQRGGRQQVSADRKPVTTTMHRLDMEKATQAALTENKKPIKPREAKIEKKIRKDIADCQSRIKSFEEEMDVAVVLQIPLMFLKWTGITQERDKPLAERSIGYLKQKVGEAEEIIWKITEINAVDPLSIYVPPAIDDDKFVYEAPPSPVLSPSPLTLFSKKGKKQDLSIAEMPKQSVAKSKHANGIGRSQGIRALEERIRKLEVEIKMSKWESYTESQTHRREMKAAWDTLLEEMKAVLESIQALEEEGQNIILLPGQKENTYKVLLVSVFATVRQETYSTEDKHLSKYLVEIDERYQQSLSSKYQHIQFS